MRGGRRAQKPQRLKARRNYETADSPLKKKGGPRGMKGLLPGERVQALREKAWQGQESLRTASPEGDAQKMQGVCNPGNPDGPDSTTVVPGSRHRTGGRAGWRSEDSDPASFDGASPDVASSGAVSLGREVSFCPGFRALSSQAHCVSNVSRVRRWDSLMEAKTHKPTRMTGSARENRICKKRDLTWSSPRDRARFPR